MFFTRCFNFLPFCSITQRAHWNAAMGKCKATAMFRTRKKTKTKTNCCAAWAGNRLGGCTKISSSRSILKSTTFKGAPYVVCYGSRKGMWREAARKADDDSWQRKKKQPWQDHALFQFTCVNQRPTDLCSCAAPASYDFWCGSRVSSPSLNPLWQIQDGSS